MSRVFNIRTLSSRFSQFKLSNVKRSYSSGGKVLSEEEKAAENVYIKKMEAERLEKLRQAEEAAAKAKASAPHGNAANETSSSTTSSSTGSDNAKYGWFAGGAAVGFLVGMNMK